MANPVTYDRLSALVTYDRLSALMRVALHRMTGLSGDIIVLDNNSNQVAEALEALANEFRAVHSEGTESFMSFPSPIDEVVRIEDDHYDEKDDRWAKPRPKPTPNN